MYPHSFRQALNRDKTRDSKTKPSSLGKNLPQDLDPEILTFYELWAQNPSVGISVKVDLKTQMLASDWLIPTLGSTLMLMPTLGFWALFEIGLSCVFLDFAGKNVKSNFLYLHRKPGNKNYKNQIPLLGFCIRNECF